MIAAVPRLNPESLRYGMLRMMIVISPRLPSPNVTISTYSDWVRIACARVNELAKSAIARAPPPLAIWRSLLPSGCMP